MKRIFAFVLCAMLLVSMLPVAAFAEAVFIDEDEYTEKYIPSTEEYTEISSEDALFSPGNTTLTNPNTTVLVEDDEYVVSFVAEGYTVAAQRLLPEEGKPVYADRPVNPAGEEKCLDYWMKQDGTRFDFSTPVTGDMTLTAHWAEEHHYIDIPEGIINYPGCETKGSKNVECTACGMKTVAEIPAQHALVSVDRQEATCTEDGHVAHYKCSVEGCGKCFQDAEGKIPLEAVSVIIPKGHDWQPVAQTEPICGSPGVAAHQKCSRCGITDPAEPATTPATGQHNWVNILEEDCLKSAATCGSPAKYFKTCSICGAKSTTEDFPVGTPVGEHNFVNNVCTACGAKRASVTVVIQGSGSGTMNGTPIVSGERVVLQNGQTVSMNFVPAEGYELSSILENGQARSNISMPYQYTAVEGLPDFTVTACFTSMPVGEPTKTVVTDESIRSKAAAKLTEIANARGSRTDVIQWEVFEVQPVWSNGTPMTATAVRQSGPIAFTMPPPVAGMTSDSYHFMTYHYVNGEFVYLSDSLTVASSDFSPFASYAIPKVIPTSSSSTSSSTSSTVLVTGKTTPSAPRVQAAPIIDDGKTQTGAIVDVDSTMEYMRKDSSEGYKPIAVSQLNDLAAGTYYVRYKETATTNPSPPTAVVVEEYYTVTLKLLYGRGGYSTDAGRYPDLSDTYLVKKGADFTVKFIPDSHWWLYVINVNDKYVGQANVKTNFTLKEVRTKTELSYGFSDSSSSPKTGDESDVLKWFAAEVISLMGMVSITYYLFRKKEY